MKKITKLLPILAVSALLTGCASVNQGVTASKLETKLTATNEAKIVVGKKVTASAEGQVILGFINLAKDKKYADGISYAGEGNLSILDSSRSLKSAAAYKAMKKSGADVLVAPTYVTEVNNYFVYKEIKVTVSAYKGKIASFK